jgi:hypothetical protein
MVWCSSYLGEFVLCFAQNNALLTALRKTLHRGQPTLTSGLASVSLAAETEERAVPLGENRESGVSPERARHCNWGVFQQALLAATSRTDEG